MQNNTTVQQEDIPVEEVATVSPPLPSYEDATSGKVFSTAPPQSDATTPVTSKWSWSSWLIGAPPMTEETMTITDPPEQLSIERDKEVVVSTEETNQPTSTTLSNAKNWIWGNAAAWFPNEETAADPSSSSSAKSPEGEGEKKNDQTSLTSMLWNNDLWSNMKKDLAEFASVMQEDTQHIIQSTTAGMKATQQLSSTLQKLGNSQLARKMGELGEKTLQSVGSLILTEEEMNQELQSTNAQCSSDRVRIQLAALLNQPERIFEISPEPVEEYEEWIHSFAPLSIKEYVESHGGELAEMLMEHSAVRQEYSRLVPSRITHEEFFLRYLYCKATLEAAEVRRESLKARAENVDQIQEEEGWGSDSGEEEDLPVPGPSTQQKPPLLSSPPKSELDKKARNMIFVDRGDLVVIRHEDSTDNTPSNSAGSSTFSSELPKDNSVEQRIAQDVASWDSEDVKEISDEDPQLTDNITPMKSEDDWA